MKNISKIIAIVLISVLLSACGEETFKKTLEVNKDFGASIESASIRIGNMYTRGAISLPTKDKLAAYLKRMSSGGRKTANLVIALSNQYAKPKDVPADKWSEIIKAFDTEVVTEFLELLKEITNLSPSIGDEVRFAISQVRNIILLLGKSFGREQSLINKINFIERNVYAGT